MSYASMTWVAAGLVALSILSVTWVLAVPSHTIPARRRRWRAAESAGDGWGERLVSWVDAVLGRRDFMRRWAYALDRAGVRMRVAEFFVLALALVVVAAAVGYLLGGLLGGLVLAVVCLAGLLMVISVRSGRRKFAFADLLDDVVQHISTNLRAGHSTLQSLETVGREIEEPAKSEILRAVNQVRIGRDLGEALVETADRMDSLDFRWVAQAIQIHRQVGGNLGEVLDTVSHTIRERQQVRRQVKALSSEGRASAWVLLALPLAVGGASALINPGYTGLLWSRGIGLAMLFYAFVSMVAGAFWLRRVVTVKY